MKKIITSLLLVITITTFAQKLEKVKGNKNVVLTERVFETLTSLELNKNIDLILMKGSENKLEIYADENLHEIVLTDLSDGNLNIALSNKITTKKKFELTLHVTELVLQKIVLNEDSTLTNNDFLPVEDIQIILNGKSEANLLLDALSVIIEANDRSKGEMSLKGEEITLNIQESAKLELNINADMLIVDSNQKSSVTLAGKVDGLNITAKNTSRIKASNMQSSKAILITDNASAVYLNAKDELEVNASGKSRIYIYGSAKINLETFKGTSSLYKK